MTGTPPAVRSRVLDVVDMLRTGPLAGLEVEVLHGRLTSEAKDRAMRRFSTGDAPILVATTVVEVGVDVATASTMVIMDADRFGSRNCTNFAAGSGGARFPVSACW